MRLERPGGGGLVPNLHADGLRGGADRRLVEAGIEQRADHAGFARGFEPGAVVAEIVGVGAVHDRREAATRAPCRRRWCRARSCSGSSGRGRSSRRRRVVELVRVDEAVRGAERERDPRGPRPFHSEGGGSGSRPSSPASLPELLGGDGQDEGAVDASGVADQHRAELAQASPQGVELLCYVRQHRSGITL